MAEEEEEGKIFCSQCRQVMEEMLPPPGATVKCDWLGCPNCDSVEMADIRGTGMLRHALYRRRSVYTYKGLKKELAKQGLFSRTWQNNGRQSERGGEIYLSVPSPAGIDAGDNYELVWIKGLPGRKVKVLCLYCEKEIDAGERTLGVIVQGMLMLVALKNNGIKKPCPHCFGPQILPDFTIGEKAADTAEVLIRDFGIEVYPVKFADFQQEPV
jgi:hypothetical protein